MLMDLYIFLNYKAYSANLTNNNIFISFKELFDAFGTFSTYKHFKSNLKKNLKKLLSLHKGLVLEDTKINNIEGLLISKFSVSNVDTKQLDLFIHNVEKIVNKIIMATITSLKQYIENNNITYEDFAFQIGVKEKTLNRYINGAYPPKNIMERIVVYTEGKVQPIDFLFQYKKESSIIEYIKDNLNKGIINRKELSLILDITSSNVSRRLNKRTKYKKEELFKTLNYIEYKINKLWLIAKKEAK